MTTTTHTVPRNVAFAAVITGMTTFFLAAGAPSPLLIVQQTQWRFAPWLLTLAFGIYAVSLLGTLLTAGRLSDYIGRRPVILAALALETAALITMMIAPNIGTVIVGRFLQGIATGAATSAFSAAAIELAPQRARAFASSIVSAAPAGGLGLGALAAAVLAGTTNNPVVIVWTTLTGLIIVVGFAVLASPEPGQTKPGAGASLRPSLTIPASVIPPFRRATPILVAAWMMAALFMGLVPITLATVFHIHDIVTDGTTAFLEPAAAAITTLLTSRLLATTALRIAAITTVAAAVTFIAGITTGGLALIDAGGFIGGVGFGTAVGGTVRATIPATADQQRAGVFAAIYAVSYLAFGVPAIISGILISFLGLTPVVIALVTVIALSAAVGAIATWIGQQNPTTTATCDSQPAVG